MSMPTSFMTAAHQATEGAGEVALAREASGQADFHEVVIRFRHECQHHELRRALAPFDRTSNRKEF